MTSETSSYPSIRNRRGVSLSLTALVAHWTSSSLYRPQGALAIRPNDALYQLSYISISPFAAIDSRTVIL